MTVVELLDLAETLILVANAKVPGRRNDAELAAMIAQAAAQLAQAMMLAQMTDVIERPGLPDRRVLNVDTGN